MKQDLVKLRHERSKRDYPGLKLEKNEYIELAIRRTRIGLLAIWAGVIGGFVAVTAVIILLSTTHGADSLGSNDAARHYLFIVLFCLYGVVLIIGFVAAHVYSSNYMYITNRRVIQITTNALFSQSTNVIDLISIEDVSFKQAGIIQYLFRYGTIRMSTVGDETTYTFPFIDTPHDEMDTITHLVHKAKESTKRRSQLTS